MSAGGRAGFNKIVMGFKKANYNFLLYFLSCLLYAVAPPCDPLVTSKREREREREEFAQVAGS